MGVFFYFPLLNHNFILMEHIYVKSEPGVTFDMPVAKRQKKNPKYSKYGKKNYKPSMPVAIRTRGTPDGYYEIPVRQLIKLYCNTSSGFWDTNQTTGASAGVTGYKGFGMSFSLDNTQVYLGNSGIAVGISNSVPGFAQLQAVFDMCKIVDVEIATWWTNQQDANSTGTSYGGFDFYIAEDPNNDDPPTSIGEIMQYQKVKRFYGTSNQTFKYKIKPHIRTSVGADDIETGTSTTLGGVQPSTYIQTTKPAVSHLGFRGYLDIPTAAAARVQTLNILVTQTRRYKMSR